MAYIPLREVEDEDDQEEEGAQEGAEVASEKEAMKTQKLATRYAIAR